MIHLIQNDTLPACSSLFVTLSLAGNVVSGVCTVYTCVHVCRWTCRDQMSILGIFVYCFTSFFGGVGQDFSLNLELTLS